MIGLLQDDAWADHEGSFHTSWKVESYRFDTPLLAPLSTTHTPRAATAATSSFVAFINSFPHRLRRIRGRCGTKQDDHDFGPILTVSFDESLFLLFLFSRPVTNFAPFFVFRVVSRLEQPALSFGPLIKSTPA